MTHRHEQLLQKAERNHHALERDLADGGNDPRFVGEREATPQVLQDLRDRRSTRPMMALISAPLR